MPGKNKVVVSIQARIGSSRLPGKVLEKICKKPMLQLMLERLSKCELIDEIIIATTNNKNDDPILVLSLLERIVIKRGSVRSLTKRIDSLGVPNPASTSGQTGTHSTCFPRISTRNWSRLWPPSYRTGSPSRHRLMPRRRGCDSLKICGECLVIGTTKMMSP